MVATYGALVRELETAVGDGDAESLARDIAALVAAGLIVLEPDPHGRLSARLSDARR